MAASDIPTPRSKVQILGEMLDAVTSRIGIRRLKKGGPLLSVLQAAAQSDVRNAQDVFTMLAAQDLDNAEDQALDRRGADESAPRFRLAKATGVVTITDTSFDKIASKVYQGSAAPIVGSTTINVEDASDFTATGQVYIGRQTANLEGPLSYTSLTDNGAYWTITLSGSTPTTRFHNKGESVILAQGGTRTIDAGTVVATPAGALATAIQFATTFSAEIPDGETEVVGVGVIATVAGASGNVPAYTVSEFIGDAPFSGATVSNTTTFVSGRDTETNNTYRDRIRTIRNSKQRGTDLAIENAVLGAVSTDESKRISSASLVRRSGGPATLYIDDGSGYEETTSGVGLETLVDLASGGENDFQALDRPIAKARLQSALTAPFTLSDGAKLAVSVGGVVSTHVFDVARFGAIGAASAYEVVSAINSDAGLDFAARTALSGTVVVLVAKAETAEDLHIVAATAPDVDANDAFQFPTSRAYTTLLYKNDRLLSKDGSLAVVRSNAFATWNAVSGSQTLSIAVDLTSAVTYTITDQDFIDAGTGFNGVGKNSPAAWAAVLNRKLPGITTTVEGDVLVLTSNLGRHADAAITVGNSDLVAELFFELGTSTGASNDYTLDRGTGQILTALDLEEDDRLTLGSTATRAFLETETLVPTTTSTTSTLWFAVDADASVITHGVGAATPLNGEVSRVTDAGLQVSLTATLATDAFANVVQGDWLVLYDADTDLPSALKKAWRVIRVEEDGAQDDRINRVVFEKRCLNVPRTGHATVRYTGAASVFGKVLVTGGFTHTSGLDAVNVTRRTGRGVTATCELYDMATGLWTYTGSMNTARARHTINLLTNGNVLVTGGVDASGNVLQSTEIYSLSTGLWTVGPTMAVARVDHTATATPAMVRIVVAGGWTGSAATASSEEYDWITNTFTNAQTMITARFGHRAVAFPAGAGAAGAEANKIFVVGGFSAVNTKTLNCERYNPSSPGWTAKAAVGAGEGRANFGLAAIATQQVIALGDGETTGALTNQNTWSVYNPTANTWTAVDFTPDLFRFQNKNLVTTTNSGIVLALYGLIPDSPHRLTHQSVVWSGPGDADVTFTELSTSLFSHIGVEKTEVTCVALSDGTATPDKVLCVAGTSRSNLNGTAGSGITTAHHEMWDHDATTWTVPDVSDLLADGTLAARGLAFIRTANNLQRVQIAAASNYTAPTWATALNAGLEGAAAATYRTSQLRVSTNSHAEATGDLMLAASDISGPSPGFSEYLPLPVQEAEANSIGHMASLESANSGVGTPYGFQVYHLLYATATHVIDAARTVFVSQPYVTGFEVQPPGFGTLNGLQRWYDGINPTYVAWATEGDDEILDEYGQGKHFRSAIVTHDAVGGTSALAGLVRLGLRRDHHAELVPHQPVVFASPYATAPDDTITIVVDQDTETKRFVVPMFRRVKPTSTTYASTNELRDVDGGDLELAQAFGINYDFDDFAVYMKARAKSHSATAAKRLLWRWFRHGPDGNNANIRFQYPEAADAELEVDVQVYASEPIIDGGVTTGNKVNVEVYLGSGAAKTASTVTATSKLGVARVNQTGTTGIFDHYIISGFNVVEVERAGAGTTTRVRIQVPNNGVVAQGPQDSGLQAGDVVWFEATAPTATTLYSGAFVVTTPGAFNAGTGRQDIYIPANVLHDGTSAMVTTASPGTVSFDANEEVVFDPSLTTGDLVRYTGATFDDSLTNQTFRVTTAARQYILGKAVDRVAGGALTTPLWYLVSDPDNLQLFGAPTQTATQVAAAVNALAAGDAAACPVTVTVTGTGLGVIDKATWDELSLSSNGYPLTDGVNYIQRTIEPATVNDETSFIFRLPITADLATESDWANEDVRLAPIHTPEVVAWLLTPTISGLFTSAEVVASSEGTKVQIASLTPGSEGSVEVQGGSGNAATATVVGSATLYDRTSPDIATMTVTVPRASAGAFLGGSWVTVDNTTTITKASWWDYADSVDEVRANGTWLFDASPYTIRQTLSNARLQIEKVGNFVALHFPRAANDNSPLLPANVEEYDYIYVTEPTFEDSDLETPSTTNRGTFRIVRFTQTEFGYTIWVENANAVDEVVAARVKILTADSTVPGDVWTVSTNRFGSGNKGTWTITTVGENSPGGEEYTTLELVVDTTDATPEVLATSTTFGDDEGLVQLKQGVPARLHKRIHTVAPNQTDPSYVDIQFDSAPGYAAISAGAGSVLTASDKLAFPTGTFLGVDGYAFSTGLVGEANRIVYGDPSDEATYPGYAAAGAAINTTGPLVKRVSIALSLRVQSGLASRSLADRVRSAVAAVVNQTGIGEPVALSAILAAAMTVPGVIAAAVVKPVFSSTADTIPVQPYEKPLVLDLEDDVLISFVGE